MKIGPVAARRRVLNLVSAVNAVMDDYYQRCSGKVAVRLMIHLGRKKRQVEQIFGAK